MKYDVHTMENSKNLPLTINAIVTTELTCYLKKK